MKAAIALPAIPKRAVASPIVMWASFGAMCLLFTVYLLATWITSADFKSIAPPSDASDFAKTAALWAQVISCTLAVICIFAWIIIPKWKTGQFSFLGLMSIAAFTTDILDPVSNFYTYGYAESSLHWNFGSWAAGIPFFSYPNINRAFPESLTFIATSTIWLNVLWALLFTWVWRQIDRRFPNAGYVKVISALLLMMLLWDVINELLFLRFELYAYVGAPWAWSINGGHFYQFPIWVGVITAFFMLAQTSLIYFRDDHGRSWAERGVDKLKIAPATKTLVRFLALVGAQWAIVIVTYFIPVQWMYLAGDGIPPDTPNHLRNNICGWEVGFPCPGKGIPLPRQDGPTPWVNSPGRPSTNAPQ